MGPEMSAPALRVDVLTLFPGLFDGFLDESIPRRAIDKGLVAVHRWDIRDWAEGRPIGGYVLSGGGGPARVVIDAVIRLIPGALGDAESALDESFGPDGDLEYPHYTRPREFRGRAVPDVLVGGDHAAIARWRQ